MTHPIVIQTTEMMEYRMVEQLRRRKVDSSLYVLGGERTAQAFKKWDEESPPTWDITHGTSQDHYGGERCVVDLGPGSGQPCLAATKVILDHIHEIVLVDVSPEMLSMAQDYLHRNTQLNGTSALDVVLAQFLFNKRLRGHILEFTDNSLQEGHLPQCRFEHPRRPKLKAWDL